MNFVRALLARSLAVERRALRTGLLRVVLQPAVYLFVFGHVVGRMLPAGNGDSYAQIMAPGVVAISVMSAPYVAVGGVLLSGFYFRTMEAWLLSPVALRSVLLALAAVGTLHGCVSAAVVALLAWAILGVVPSQPLLMAWFCIAGPLFFSLFSIAVLLTPATPRQGQELLSFLTMPMTFFGCTFYSFAMLQAPFDWLALCLPTTYLSEGLRAAYGATAGGLHGGTVAAGLALAILLLAPLADWLLRRRLRDFTW